MCKGPVARAAAQAYKEFYEYAAAATAAKATAVPPHQLHQELQQKDPEAQVQANQNVQPRAKPLLLKQMVALILDTQVQVLTLLEVGVTKAARDAYRTAHGLDDNTDSDGSDSDADDYDDEDENVDDASAGAAGGASSSTSNYNATLINCSLPGVAQLAYLLLAEGFAADRLPAVLRPGYLVQVCEPLVRTLIATDNRIEVVMRGASDFIALLRGPFTRAAQASAVCGTTLLQ